MCHLLCQHGADVNVVLSPRKLRPLHLACEMDHIEIEICKILIQYGALISQEDAQMKTPLHYVCDGASLAGYSSAALQCCEYLLAQGADVHAMDDQGRTPLMTAAYNKSNAMMDLLLHHGNCLTLRDHYQQNVLDAFCLSLHLFLTDRPFMKTSGLIKKTQSTLNHLIAQGYDLFETPPPIDFSTLTQPQKEFLEILKNYMLSPAMKILKILPEFSPYIQSLQEQKELSNQVNPPSDLSRKKNSI